jgi:hypothetical protein
VFELTLEYAPRVKRQYLEDKDNAPVRYYEIIPG